MSTTLSFHVDSRLEKLIRRDARKRGVSVSRYLKDTIESTLDPSRKTGKEIGGFLCGQGDLEPDETILDPWNAADPRLAP